MSSKQFWTDKQTMFCVYGTMSQTSVSREINSKIEKQQRKFNINEQIPNKKILQLRMASIVENRRKFVKLNGNLENEIYAIDDDPFAIAERKFPWTGRSNNKFCWNCFPR